MAGLMRLRPLPKKTTFWKTLTIPFPGSKLTQLKDTLLPFTATLHPSQWNFALLTTINSSLTGDLYFMGHMMAMVMVELLHSLYHFQQKKKQVGVFTLKRIYYEKETLLLFRVLQGLFA